MSVTKEMTSTEEDLNSFSNYDDDDEEHIDFEEECSYETGWSEITSADRVDNLHEQAEANRHWLGALRYLVFSVLAATAILVGLQSVRVSRRKIEEDFHYQVSEKVASEMVSILHQVLQAFFSFSLIMSPALSSPSRRFVYETSSSRFVR
jgi:hypothetical protein